VKIIMKLTGLSGLLSLLSIVACSGGAPAEAVTAPEPVAPQVLLTIDLPARLSEYVFLHRNREESAPLHVMAGMSTCP
jgi:hypothetical protein